MKIDLENVAHIDEEEIFIIIELIEMMASHHITLSFLFLFAFSCNGVLSKTLFQQQHSIPSRMLEQNENRIMASNIYITSTHLFTIVLEPTPTQLTDTQQAYFRNTTERVLNTSLASQYPNNFKHVDFYTDSIEWKPAIINENIVSSIPQTVVLVNEVEASFEQLHYAPERSALKDTVESILRDKLATELRKGTSHGFTSINVFVNDVTVSPSSLSTRLPTSNPRTRLPTSNPSSRLPTSNPTKITSTTVTTPTPQSEMQNNPPNKKGQGLRTASKPTSSTLPLVAGLSIGAYLIILAAFCFVKRRRRRIHAKEERDKHHQVVDDLTCSPSVTKGKVGMLNVQLNRSESSNILDEEELTCAPSVTHGRIISRGAENLGEQSDLDTEMVTIPRGICITRQYSSGGLSIGELSHHSKSSLSLASSKGSTTGSLSSASMHSTRTEESFEVKHILGMSLQKGMLSSDEDSHESILKNTAGRRGRHYGIRGDSALSPTDFNASSLVTVNEFSVKEGKRDVSDKEDTIHEHVNITMKLLEGRQLHGNNDAI